jgi:hypothetical protein
MRFLTAGDFMRALVRRVLWVVVVSLVVVAPASGAKARRIVAMNPAPAAGAGGVINLPYQVSDSTGTTWMIYGAGWLQQQGNMPMYSQGAMLYVNQNQPQMNNNQAKLDAKTGEVIFENLPGPNCVITRRIKVDKEPGSARYIDVFKNTTNTEQTYQVMLQTNTNYSVNSAQVMNDPKRKQNPGQIAWIAQTSGNRTVVEMYAGKGAKQTFNIAYQQGNNQVSANISLTIPAGKEAAVMHIHTLATDPQSGQKWVESLKESQLMKEIAPALRKLIVNFTSGSSFVGDFEILRGDQNFDVVELRTGDQYRGTVKEPTYKLTTFYGPVELPVEKVIGLINVGEYRPRQLVITVDGEIFGGKLDKETLAVELSSGQVTQVPLSQITRLGYRKRPNEPEEWTFDKPLVLMRSGERIGVQVPQYDIDVATRYGALRLKPSTIATLTMANDEHGIHEISLSDGSKFAGLVSMEKFEMKLSAGNASVVFPSSAIGRIQFSPRVEDLDDSLPTLTLSNEDQLVGTLAGKLKLETAFDVLNLDAAQIKTLRHAKGSVQDVQVTLWDETTVSGQLAETELACNLKCGVSMKVPVALVEEYSQPTPQPSGQIVEKAKQLVAELSAEDWKARDRAETQLVGLGPVIISTLKQLRPTQTPEAQQRIDAVLKTLEKQQGGGATTAPGPGTGAVPGAPPGAGPGVPQAAPDAPPAVNQAQRIEAPRD